MAENVKGLAMRYKHDGVVYELDSGKLVHTKGEQSIDGKKVFKTVPQVEGAPVEDNDVTNKKYVQDALDAFAAPKVASFTITAKNSANAAQGAAPVEINKLKIFLADGRRLDPVFMEEGDLKGSTEAKLLVLTLNKQDQSDLTPTKVAKTEIESYALKDGEFLGKLYPCKFFGQHQDMYSNSGYQDPWNQYWTKADRFWDQEKTTSGQVRIDIFDIDQMVQKLTFTSTSSGREAVFTATANDGAKEENGDVQKKENHVFDIVFPKMGEMLSKPGPVLLSTNQVVKDVKTFATPPKSANDPVANDDVANKAYVDNLNNELKGYVDGLIQKPGFDIELQIGVTALTSWNAFSQLNILLDNGKRLEAKYVEDGIKTGSDPAKVVLVMTDNPDAEIPEPELKQASFFDTYELGSNEYACEFYNATAMGLGTIHSDPRQANPWRAYLVNGITSGQKGYYLKIVIKQLQDAVSTVQFYCGDKHNGYGYPPKNFLFKASCNGVTTDEQVSKDNPGRKDLIKFDIPADALPLGDNYVDLVSEQTINGVKTFLTPPKSVKAPTDAKDIANKAYVDNRLGAGFDVTFTIKQSFSATWGGLSKLHVELAKGVLEAKYVEDVMPANAKEPALVVWTTKSTATKDPQVTYKSKDDIKGYELQDGEYLGDITYAELLGPYKSHTSTDYRCPFDTYLYNGGVLGQKPLIKVNIYALKQAVKSVRYLNGYDGSSYVGADHAVDFVVNNVESTSTLTGAGTSDDAPFVFTPTVKTLFDNEKSNYVPIKGDAIIFDKKTFTKKVFITDPDLSSEMVTGQVATRENLKAVGVIGPGIPSTQYLLVGGYMPKWEGTTTVIYQPYTLNRLKVGIEGGELFLKMTDSGTTQGDAILYQSILSRVKEFEVTGENYTKVIKTPEEVENYVLKPGEYRVWCRCTKYKYSYETNASVSANGFANLYIEDLDFEHSESGITDLKVPVSLHKSWMLHIGAARSTSTNIFAMPYFELIFFNAPKVTSFTLGIGKERNSVNNIKVYSAQGDAYSDFSKITLPANITQLETLLNKGTNGYFEDSQGNNGIGNIEHTGKDYIKSFSVELDDSVSQPNETPNKYPATETYLQAVTTINDQDIAGNKTFIKPITCTEPPVENGHLVNKKYVDDELAKLVARIAALEAAKP